MIKKGKFCTLKSLSVKLRRALLIKGNTSQNSLYCNHKEKIKTFIYKYNTENKFARKFSKLQMLKNAKGLSLHVCKLILILKLIRLLRNFILTIWSFM